MRYWIMTDECLPFNGGGIGTYVPEMARILHDAGHEVTIILSDEFLETPILVEQKSANILVRFNPDFWCPYAELGGFAKLSFAFSNVVFHLSKKYGPPDYIESQECNGLAYFTLQRKLTREPGFPIVPVVLRSHGPLFVIAKYNDQPLYQLPNYWIYEMERFCITAADIVLSPSRVADRHILAECPSARLARVVNPMKPVGPFDVTTENRNDLYFLGRVQPVKGILELLDGFSAFCARNDTARLVVIGRSVRCGTRNRDFQNLLEEKYRGIIEDGRLEFRGQLERDIALQELASASAVFVPSRYDNFGYTALEAMSLKRVVVASKQVGFADYIDHGKNGLLFDITSSSDVIGAIDAAVNLSDSERAKIGEAAWVTSQEFDRPAELLLSLDKALSAGQAERRHFPVVRPEPKTTKEQGARKGRLADLLSVVVPYYNLGDYVSETIESILRCDYRPIEIIVVNDASTCEKSIAALDRILESTPEEGLIKIVHKENNAGLSEARNTGVDHARGEFIVSIDADDMVEKEYFSRAIKVLQTYSNVGFVGCWVQYFGDDDASWITWNPEPPYLLYRNAINSASIVCRTQLVDCYGRNDPAMRFGMEDYESVVRMVGHGVVGVALPQKLFRYRVRPDSMMRRFNPTNMTLSHELIAHKNQQLFLNHAEVLKGLVNANGPGWADDRPILGSRERQELIDIIRQQEEVKKTWFEPQLEQRQKRIEELENLSSSQFLGSRERQELIDIIRQQEEVKKTWFEPQIEQRQKRIEELENLLASQS